MPNILFLSANRSFQDDLISQIEQNLPDYKVYGWDDNQTVFDIAILDGKEFLPDFRINHVKVPALILEPSDSDETTSDKLDMFVFKPLQLSHLLNQIKSGINVFENSADGFLHFGEYELHPVDKDILNTITGKSAKLTEREVSIIQYLYKSRGKAVSKNELLQNVWEYSGDVTTHTIETHIYRLRKKVEQETAGAQIVNAEEGGYRLLF